MIDGVLVTQSVCVFALQDVLASVAAGGAEHQLVQVIPKNHRRYYVVARQYNHVHVCMNQKMIVCMYTDTTHNTGFCRRSNVCGFGTAF